VNTLRLRAHGNPIGDRVTQELIHRLRVHALPGQIAVLGITFQQAAPFQEAPDALCESLGQGEYAAVVSELGRAVRESRRAPGVDRVYSPAEPAWRQRRAGTGHCRLGAAVYAALSALASDLGVPAGTLAPVPD